MELSKRYGILLTLVLAIVPLSVEAGESIALLTNSTSLPVSESHAEKKITKTVRDPGRLSQAGGVLDIAFVLGNGFIGYLLLRRVNKKT